MKKNLHHARQNYQRSVLDEKQVERDPLEQFVRWFDEYQSMNVLDFNAMTLSTVNEEGVPSSRIVLLKAINQGGFEFYTNYQSNKARAIEANPAVALNFYWPQMERQVRVEGVAEKTREEDSDAYFASRPRGSQIGAWVSEQSKAVENRAVLDHSLRYFEEKFAQETSIPRPPHWGGFRVIPQRIEFWQGRSDRLHDRVSYRKTSEGWVIQRLAP